MSPHDQTPRSGMSGQPARRPAGRAQDAAAWDRLRDAGNLKDLAPPWLDLQLRQAGADAGAVFVSGPAGCVALARLGEAAEAEVNAVASRCLETAAAAVHRPEETPRAALIGQPVIGDGRPWGAVVIRVPDASPQRLRNAGRSLTWGVAWLREVRLREQTGREADARAAMRTAHEIFAAALEHDEAHAAALEVVNRLAGLSGADRVSLGFRKRGRSDLYAVSHSAEFGKQMSLNRQVTAAMDEAIDQRAALCHPPPADEVNTTRAQGELARVNGQTAVLSVPFLVGDMHRGAVTFERDGERPFGADEVGFLDFAISLAGPALWEKRANDRWLISKTGETLWRQFTRLVGPGYAGRKLALLAVAILAVILANWSGPARVTADASVEGSVIRGIAAPFDGYIREADLRAGDEVTAGAVIAALDDRDIALERLRWLTEKRQKQLEYNRALGEGNRSEAQIIRAQIAQADAQIALNDARLARAQLVAPFDGVIVSGDLSHSIGSSVNRGDLLFEVAPEGETRIALSVEESRIADMDVGDTGTLVVTALPDHHFPIVIRAITPVATVEDGHNRFRVEASLTGPGEGIGPGMKGVAKIDAGQELMVAIWTREARNWVRLKLWQWFG